MTEVSFHFNVPDRTDYTCRLLRKASRTGSNVVLTGPAQVLAHFDRALWTFDPIEFLPHLMLHPGKAHPSRLRDTKVWLAEDATQPGHHDVLVNLGMETAPGFESFTRVIEVVTANDADRLAARARWKHYAARGYVIDRFEVGA